MYPSLVAERERRRRGGQRKWVAFALAASRLWMKYSWLRVELEADGRPHVAVTPLVFIGNNEYELNGLQVGGRRSLTAGRLHVCIAPRMTRLDLVRTIGAALVGRAQRGGSVQCTLLTSCSIRAGRRTLLVSTDGEVARLSSPLRYRIHPGALRVLVPGGTDTSGA
jgi:diacylglycerol kinase family enzyme